VREQAPLLGALIVIALVIAFSRARKTTAATTAPAPTASSVPLQPSEPDPIPEEPPFEALRAENAELPCEVDDVFARKCRRCHSIPPRHGAPVTFYTWTDLQAPRGARPLYEAVGRVVQTGFMPLRIPTNPPVEALTAEEKETLLNWVAAGAPRGSCKPAPAKKRARPIRPTRTAP
jgi:hypothetical protein